MSHPATRPEIIVALESNAQSILTYYSSLPDREAFEGDPDHWGPAHHLVHLTQSSVAVAGGLRSGSLPLHPTARSRTYAEVRDAATTSLAATPKDRLLERGRRVVIAPGTRLADLGDAFASASAAVRSAASTWTEDALDRHAMAHPLIGEMTVREMLLFFIVHERHHLKIVRARFEPHSTSKSRPPVAADPPAIRTKGLRKVYPLPRARRGAAGPGPPVAALTPDQIVALDSLDLEVKAGEFFGLLGPNGAGKTTTLGILTTRVRPTAGEAWVGGIDVVRQEVAVRHLIGVVPQRPNPDRSLSVRENLTFHAAYFGVPKATAAGRAREMLETFGLADRADSQVEKLSGGQQQRMMIARALMHDPEVMFLDEPTVGLDPQARLALWEILRELHGQGRTIIMTTHYMEEADRLCGRVAIVDRGQLLALDSPAALKAQAPGGTLIEVTLDGDAAAAAEDAGAVAGVARAEAEGPVLRAWSPRAGEAVAGLIHAAEQAGRQVRDIHLAPPSLETLFIALTGRKLE